MTLGIGVGTVALSATPAMAVGTYDNAAVADKALSYVGQWGGNACNDAQKPGDSGGQCRAFVNCIVWMVSSHAQNLGGADYFQSFLNAGGVEVTDANNLAKGDIVQVGQGTHTFIIVSRVSGNTFNVVDSNHAMDEMVMNYNRTFTLDSNTRAFRMGSVGGSSTTPTDAVTAVSSQQVSGTEHVYWGTANGVLRETWFNAQSGAFTNTAWNFGHKITALSSQYTSADMAQHVYVGTDNGGVYEAWWSPSSGGYQVWNVWTSDSAILSLDSRRDSGGTTHLYWGSASGRVDETWFNPSQGAHTWEIFHSDTAVYGMTSQYTSDGTQHVYWGNAQGRLHESFFKPGWGPFTNLMAQFPQAIGGLSSQTEPDGSQHIMSADNDGIVRETWFSATSGGYNTWSAATLGSAPHAISSQYTPDGNMHAYTGNDSEVDEIWYHPGAVGSWAASNTPHVMSISSQVDSGGTTHLFWGSTDGGVRETWFRPGAVNTWQLPTSP
jgi:hypothetical protein